METVDKNSPYSGTTSQPPRRTNCFGLDLALRMLLFATSLSALVLLVTSKETQLVPTSLPPPLPPFIPRPAKFNHSPALIYLLAALAVTVLYSLISMLIAAMNVAKPLAAAGTLFLLILLDVIMAGIMASATGTAGSVAYVGLRGNSHVNWNKICGVYGKFCRHVGASTLLSLVSAVILVLLVIISAFSLFRRAR